MTGVDLDLDLDYCSEESWNWKSRLLGWRLVSLLVLLLLLLNSTSKLEVWLCFRTRGVGEEMSCRISATAVICQKLGTHSRARIRHTFPTGIFTISFAYALSYKQFPKRLPKFLKALLTPSVTASFLHYIRIEPY